jgi:type IV secretory pathway VirB2 component (pilin)
MAVASSLFDAHAAPVLPAVSEWISGTLFGDIAAILCVLAVAFVGITLMAGRLALRDGLRVAIGCFVMLGAPVIAAGLRSAAVGAVSSPSLDSPTLGVSPMPAPLPPKNHDPYAEASLRRD